MYCLVGGFSYLTLAQDPELENSLIIHDSAGTWKKCCRNGNNLSWTLWCGDMATQDVPKKTPPPPPPPQQQQQQQQPRQQQQQQPQPQQQQQHLPPQKEKVTFLQESAVLPQVHKGYYKSVLRHIYLQLVYLFVNRPWNHSIPSQPKFPYQP